MNYHLPKTIDEFIHRIRRFGGLGSLGKAVSFFDPEFDGPMASELIQILKQVWLLEKFYFKLNWNILFNIFKLYLIII